MKTGLYNHSWCSVDIKNAEQNIRYFKQNYAQNCKLMCVVKANAYGHGVKSICPAFEKGGADWFAVATLSEAIELRVNGVNLPILILGYTAPEDASVLYGYHITQTVHCLEYAKVLSQNLKSGENLTIHIKADTGMGRIGFDCINREMAEICSEIKQIKELKNLNMQGIFTHFSVADEDSEDCISYSDKQAERFSILLTVLEQNDILFLLKHCSNSAAIMSKTHLKWDMVRLGIAAYGLSPNGKEYAGLEGTEPLMELKTTVSQVKEIKAGTGISYGKTFISNKVMRVATLCIGYADGFRRSPSASNYVLIHGKKAPLLGRVCMDQCIVDISDIPDVKMGDEAVIFGYSEGTYLSANEVASMWGTINYEVVCDISSRVKRVYVRSYHTILQTISQKYSEILGNNLVGIYVHGSIAFNCFNWDKSDIDFLVVVSKPLSRDIKLSLLEVLEALRKNSPPKGLEMSVVLKQYCINFEYPTPYELHFSNGWLKRYLENPLLLCDSIFKTDRDLAAHFTVIKKVGIVLCGPSIKDVFGEVSKEKYIDSIKYDIENARNEILENPMYIVLNLCRVLAYIKCNLVLSKEQGGKWGLDNLPKVYHDVLKQALISYKSQEIMDIDQEKAMNFCDYMLGQIF